MKKFFTIMRKFGIPVVFFLFINGSYGQSYLVGPVDPNVGANANYTTHNHLEIFDVMNSTGVYLDSITIYPFTASTSYTIRVENSAQVQIASYTGVSTVGGNLPERIKANIFIPFGTGYRLGLTTGSVGMLRNSTGIQYPYTVPNVISFTGSTFQTTYWYFFYNIRVSLPVTVTDAAITAIISPADSVCSGDQPVSVVIKNNGPSTLTSTDINWKVNNAVQTALNWSGTININDSATVTLGNYNFLTGTSYEITAYLSNTNNTNDTVTGNDTLTKTGIIVKPSPTGMLTTTNATICQGDSVLIEGTLTGTPPWSIIISDGTTNHQINNIQSSPFSETFIPNQTTTYTLTSVSDGTGCTSQLTESVQITVMLAPPANIIPSGPTSFCHGDSVGLIGTIGSGFTYQWYKDGVLLPGEDDFSLVVKEQGDYTVMVTSPDNCSAVSAPQSVIVFPLPVVDLGSDTVLLPNQNILLDAGAGYVSYLWVTGATTQTLLVDTFGLGIGVRTIWVMVNDQNGCAGTDTILINFTQHPGVAGFDNEKRIVISPNPSDGLFNISLAGFPAEEIFIEVIGMDGRVVKKITNELRNKKVQKIECDLRELREGMYLFKVGNEDEFSVMKIIIRR